MDTGCVAKMRPNKEIEFRSDSIGTEKALATTERFASLHVAGVETAPKPGDTLL